MRKPVPLTISEVMSRIRSKGNLTTEMKFVKILRRHRISGWRRHMKITGTPDIVFSKAKVAVFLDGCFWHGCPVCYRPPKTNADYWIPKIDRNKSRDRAATSALRKKGWRVVRFWECSLTNEARIVAKLIKKLRATPAKDL